MSGVNLPLPQKLLDRIATAGKRQGRTLRQEIERTLRLRYESKAADE